jgi:WD40 repeat protein
VYFFTGSVTFYQHFICCCCFFLVETSLLSVSDNEILQFEWTLSSDKEGESDTPFPKSIAKASSSCCYNCATVTDNKQLLAVTTSKDNILLYNIDSAEQIFEYVGHSGLVYCIQKFKKSFQLNFFFQLAFFFKLFSEPSTLYISLPVKEAMIPRNGCSLARLTKL